MRRQYSAVSSIIIADGKIQGEAMKLNLNRSVLIIISITVALASGLLIARSSINQYFDPSHPSDAVLETNFWKHEADFKLLVDMAQADQKVIRIANDFTWLDTNAAWPRPESEWGISNERWDQYRALFKKLGLSGGILKEERGEVTYLISSTKGLITNGTSKGYAYSKNESLPIVESLDNANSWPKGKRVIFKKLKEHWYLFYMSA